MIHLLHVIPEPETVHQWPGVYGPPDATKESQEASAGGACSKKGKLGLLRTAVGPAGAKLEGRCHAAAQQVLGAW